MYRLVREFALADELTHRGFNDAIVSQIIRQRFLLRTAPLTSAYLDLLDQQAAF